MTNKFTKEDVIRMFEEAMMEGEPQGMEQDFSQVAQRIKEIAEKNKMGNVNATSI